MLLKLFSYHLQSPKEKPTSETMRPSAILKNLPFRVPARFSGSPVVTPLPIRSAFGQKVSAELDHLVQSSATITNTSWLLDALDASIATQKIAREFFDNAIKDSRDLDRSAIDHYLDDNIELLDACNDLSEKIDIVHEYVESLKVVTHLLDAHGKNNSEPNVATLLHAQNRLHLSKSIEMQCNQMNKFCFGLYRKQSQKRLGCFESEIGEILKGSLGIVSIVCGVLGIALSFKSKHSFSVMQRGNISWLNLLEKKVMGGENGKCRRFNVRVFSQSQRTVVAAHAVRDQIKCQKENDEELWLSAEELKRSWRELEEGTKLFEGRVKELYRNLISFRMVLLEIPSQA